MSDVLLNTIRVPEDAGEYAPQLQRMLERVPENWGRWVRFEAGWYKLVTDLDVWLSRLYPNYEIQQFKEKFGSLRFYWEPTGAERDGSRRAQADALVTAAEVISMMTCETCGSPDGSVRNRKGWYKTLCPTHAEEFMAR